MDLEICWVEETGLEPQQQPFTNGISSEVQMSISVLQTLIALVGIVGNSAVIYAYQSKKNRVTSENLIMILGAIDVMCCIYWAVSNTLKVFYDHFFPLYLCLPDNFMQSFFTLVSMQMMVLTAGNRFIAVVYPLKYGTLFSSKKVARIVVGIFAVSVIQSSLFTPLCFYFHGLFPEYDSFFLNLSNRYWTVSTSACYFIIIIAISFFSYRSAVNLKQSIKTAEKLRQGPERCQTSASHSPAASFHGDFTPKKQTDEHDNLDPNQNSSSCQTEPHPEKRAVNSFLQAGKSLGNKLAVTMQKSGTGESETSITSHNHECCSLNETGGPNCKKVKSKAMQRDLRLTKALLAVAIAYIICCTPYTVYIVVFRLLPDNLLMKVSPLTQISSKLFTYTLYLCNYVINPFTYLVFNEFFRSRISELPFLSFLAADKAAREEEEENMMGCNEPEERPTQPTTSTAAAAAATAGKSHCGNYKKVVLISHTIPDQNRRETLISELQNTANRTA
ncbi:uncharacterized protein LOC142357620 isoform X2 [Convolutriloba macropyga]|uniref:uncharacterized protein LOC142357620 isoform X2 n=1 Tax=Convolutriloba macropyga TaxID=536237 RepID=UPI003F524337